MAEMGFDLTILQVRVLIHCDFLNYFLSYVHCDLTALAHHLPYGNKHLCETTAILGVCVGLCLPRFNT